MESPSQLARIEKKKGTIVEEEDSYDYDSYLSSNSADDTPMRLPKNDTDDDDIDEEQLDAEERALLARVNALKQYLPKYQKKEVNSMESPGSIPKEASSPEKVGKRR